MSKVSSFQKNKHREKLATNHAEKRAALKTVIMDKQTSIEDRLEAVQKLAALPRNGAKTRVRNRCEVSGRPRAFYRKFKMSRIALRQLGSKGLIPGLKKASW